MTSASDESDLKGSATAPAVTETQSPTPPNEKQPDGDHHHHLHLHHAHHHGSRLLQFIHPHTGRTTHVVHTPEELERRRSELARQGTNDSSVDFDVILKGSPEHHDAIRGLHAHHKSEQDKLKEEHPNVYEKFEHVRSELDALNAELQMLTDHSVALDASFDKFGYSAHLRTKDDSESASLRSDHSNAAEKHKDRSAHPLKFFKRPVVRQYFHKGLLWRSARAGEVPSFELFIDLVYVGVIDIIGEKAVEHPSGLALLHFFIVFSISWKVWADMTNVINWFDIDDIFQRICVAFYLVCLFGFTTNIYYMFEREESTYKSAIAFYIAQRLFLGLWYLMVAKLVPMIRGTMISNALLITTAVTFWIGSMHLHWPAQISLIMIGIVIDLFGNILLIYIMRKTNRGGFGRSTKKWFEFFPAINIEHRVERNNAFVALVFGYSILTILYQSHSSFGINAFFGKGVLGLIQAFAFNWIYFEIDAYHIHVHAIRRHWFSASLWTTMHLPFIMGYVLAAATLSKLVLAHDSADADPHNLGSHYEERSVANLDSASRWFYCGGLGVALISMGVISLTHTHKRLSKARLMKRPRIAIRAAVAVIIICLPLAESLTSLSLIAITTSLTIFILTLDLYGNSAQGSSFWTGGCCVHERKKTSYIAHHRIGRRRREEIKRAMERGEKVGLAELLRRQGSVSSVDSEMGGGGKGGGSVGSSGTNTPRDEEWMGGHY